MMNQLSSFGGYIGSSFGYYYNQLSIEQKQEVNNILGSLGLSIGEVEFYFGFIFMSLGGISFFAFVFLLKKNPNLINNLRAQAAAMGFGAFGAAGYFSVGNPTSTPVYSSPTTPVYSPPTTPVYGSPTTPVIGNPNFPSPKQIGDAFLTVFSPKDLENLKNGGSLDLKNGVLSNLNDLAKYDKNGDGKISGDELKELQVSIDYNKDGKIDKNEIKSAADSNIKEIDVKSGKVITNDGKEFDLKVDPKVNIGGENKPALIIDSNKDGKPTKDPDNKLKPGDFSQFGSKTENKSSGNSSIKEIDVKSGKVITNDGKEFDLKADPKVNNGSSRYSGSSGASVSQSSSSSSSSSAASGSSGSSGSRSSSGSSGSIGSSTSGGRK
jgi:hypothetical protein